jgi:hypothetical protein
MHLTRRRRITHVQLKMKTNRSFVAGARHVHVCHNLLYATQLVHCSVPCTVNSCPFSGHLRLLLQWVNPARTDQPVRAHHDQDKRVAQNACDHMYACRTCPWIRTVRLFSLLLCTCTCYAQCNLNGVPSFAPPSFLSTFTIHACVLVCVRF